VLLVIHQGLGPALMAELLHTGQRNPSRLRNRPLAAWYPQLLPAGHASWHSRCCRNRIASDQFFSWFYTVFITIDTTEMKLLGGGSSITSLLVQRS